MDEHAATYDAQSGRAAGGTALAHIMPPGVLLAVFAALMAMTAITVAITWVNLGPWNLVAAMAIATFKASLVALYFMHLRYDQPFNALVFVAALAFLALFLALTLMDTVDAEPDVQQFQQSLPAAVSRASS